MGLADSRTELLAAGSRGDYDVYKASEYAPLPLSRYQRV